MICVHFLKGRSGIQRRGARFAREGPLRGYGHYPDSGNKHPKEDDSSDDCSLRGIKGCLTITILEHRDDVDDEFQQRYKQASGYAAGESFYTHDLSPD